MSPFLVGRLLVATPRITEPVFRRAVVQLLHHDTAGAHGVVLNKPLGVDVDRVLPGWSAHVSPPHTLFQGGPVGLDTALGLAWLPGDVTPEGVHRLFNGLGVVDLDVAPVSLAASIAGLRVFAGYSGWGPGQLEGELAGGSWYVVPPAPSDIVVRKAEQLWRDVLRRQPGRLAFVSAFPDDPERN